MGGQTVDIVVSIAGVPEFSSQRMDVDQRDMVRMKKTLER
jgi:hypothetical protein